MLNELWVSPLHVDVTGDRLRQRRVVTKVSYTQKRPKRTPKSPAHLRDFVRTIVVAPNTSLLNSQTSSPSNFVRRGCNTKPICPTRTYVGGTCNICFAHSINTSELSVCALSRAHMENSVVRQRWTCEFCPKLYQTERSMRRHYIRDHRHYFVKYQPPKFIQDDEEYRQAAARVKKGQSHPKGTKKQRATLAASTATSAFAGSAAKATRRKQHRQSRGQRQGNKGCVREVAGKYAGHGAEMPPGEIRVITTVGSNKLFTFIYIT